MWWRLTSLNIWFAFLQTESCMRKRIARISGTGPTPHGIVSRVRSRLHSWLRQQDAIPARRTLKLHRMVGIIKGWQLSTVFRVFILHPSSVPGMQGGRTARWKLATGITR
jgi:hypothetical protein